MKIPSFSRPLWILVFISSGLIEASATVEIVGLRARSNSELYTIDATSGNARFAEDTEIFVGSGLAPGLTSDSLWAINREELFAVSRVDGSSTVVKNFGSALDGEGLAFDKERGLLYVSDFTAGQVYCIDPDVGSLALLASGVNLHGLAYCATREVLYGVGTENLYAIDISTGTLTVVGPLGVELSTGGSGLAYDSVADVLYAVSRNQSDLLTINPATGASASAGPLGTGALHGLAVVDNGLPPMLEFVSVFNERRQIEERALQFSGFLQTSTDLETWTTIVPQPLSPFMPNLEEDDNPLFFRTSLVFEEGS